MSRKVAVAAAIAFLGAAPPVGCGLTADFSGLQGGATDAGGPEAAAESSIDGGAESSLGGDGEASTSDAGYCASLPTPVHFCADFDEGQPVGAGWSSTDEYAGSSVLLDYTYYSPPASFLSSIDSSSVPASARLQEDVPIDASHVHVEFEMLLPQIATGNLEVCTLHQPVADGTTYGVFYKYQDGALLVFARSLGGDGGEVDYTGTIGPPPTGWLHVQIDIDVGASGSIVVKHGSTVVVNAPSVDTSTTTRASMFVELGYYSSDPATAIAHFDNVVVDWQ